MKKNLLLEGAMPSIERASIVPFESTKERWYVFLKALFIFLVLGTLAGFAFQAGWWFLALILAGLGVVHMYEKLLEVSYGWYVKIGPIRR